MARPKGSRAIGAQIVTPADLKSASVSPSKPELTTAEQQRVLKAASERRNETNEQSMQPGSKQSQKRESRSAIEANVRKRYPAATNKEVRQLASLQQQRDNIMRQAVSQVRASLPKSFSPAEAQREAERIVAAQKGKNQYNSRLNPLSKREKAIKNKIAQRALEQRAGALLG